MIFRHHSAEFPKVFGLGIVFLVMIFFGQVVPVMAQNPQPTPPQPARSNPPRLAELIRNSVVLIPTQNTWELGFIVDKEFVATTHLAANRLSGKQIKHAVSGALFEVINQHSSDFHVTLLQIKGSFPVTPLEIDFDITTGIGEYLMICGNPYAPEEISSGQVKSFEYGEATIEFAAGFGGRASGGAFVNRKGKIVGIAVDCDEATGGFRTLFYRRDNLQTLAQRIIPKLSPVKQIYMFPHEELEPKGATDSKAPAEKKDEATAPKPKPDAPKIAVQPKILAQTKPSYSPKARCHMIQGKIVISAEFRADGTIGEVTVTRSLGFGLDERAIEATRQLKFEPAKAEDGSPVTVRRKVEFSFNLI